MCLKCENEPDRIDQVPPNTMEVAEGGRATIPG